MSFPYFEKAKWTDVVPEFNPYKYNSFPANAAFQTWELTGRVQKQVKRLADAGRAGEIPRILTFSSLVDATVSTPATIDRLYGRLADNGSELVLFDANRTGPVQPFLGPGSAALLGTAVADRSRRYVLTVVRTRGPRRARWSRPPRRPARRSPASSRPASPGRRRSTPSRTSRSPSGPTTRSSASTLHRLPGSSTSGGWRRAARSRR